MRILIDFYLISILFFLTIISCHKDEPVIQTQAEIIVTDNSTGEPLEGAIVFVYKQTGGSFWGGGSGSSTILLLQDTTDVSGIISFPYVDSNNVYYRCSVYRDNYYEVTDLAILHTYIGEGIDIDIGLTAYAWLSIHFKNEPPSLPSDNFGINGNVSDGFNGNDIDTTVIYLVFGSQEAILLWQIYDSTIYHDTIYCPRFDTTYYEIFY